MRMYSIIVKGLLSTLPLVLFSPAQAQNNVLDPFRIESIPEKPVDTVPPRSAIAAPIPEKIAPPAASATVPVVPPAGSAVVSDSMSSGCSTCGVAPVCAKHCGHPLLAKLFHPFRGCGHKSLGCKSCFAGHRSLFKHKHGCKGCAGGDGYLGAVAEYPQQGFDSTSWAMDSMPAPYGYAYYPYPSVAFPVDPISIPTIVTAKAENRLPVTPEILAEWKGLPANTLYGKALDGYWERDYRSALEMFWILVESNPDDSRFWYYKALTERALGDVIAAKTSAQRGAAVEYLDPAQAKLANNVLERIQGSDREFLRDPGTDITSGGIARSIVARPMPKREALGSIDEQVIQTRK